MIALTDDGRYGRALDGKSGDGVWLLCGTQFLHLVRPVSGKYQLASHGFVHGAEYREWIQGAGAGERQTTTSL